MKTRWLILLGLLCALQACGFQLRGFSSIPEQFSNLQVITDGLTKAQQRELNSQLQRAGAKLNYAAEQQPAVLSVSVEPVTEREIVNSAGATQTTVRLARRLRYSLSDTAGKQLVTNKSLQQTYELKLDKDNLLGIESEKQQAIKSMDQALFNSLLIQLRGL